MMLSTVMDIRDTFDLFYSDVWLLQSVKVQILESQRFPSLITVTY